MNRSATILTAAALALITTPALAHPGHLHDLGFLTGLLHPVSGLDHILAMLLVGVIAGIHGGRKLWVLPASFMALMLAGFAFGAAGTPLPMVEAGIALSVVALGLLTALTPRLALPLIAAFVGLFGFFHGHAHGSEAGSVASLFAYAAGFSLATLALHAGGIGFALLTALTSGEHAVLRRRIAGGAALVAGLALLAGL